MCSGADKHAYTALWSGGEHSAVTFWGFVHVLVGSKLKLVKWLMRAVSRLQLQMNRTQCPVWPFDFRFYCSSSSSSTYFSGYLLFNLQNNVFLYHFFHFYRFNTPYPPPSLISRSFPDDPKADWNISLVSTVIMNHIESHAFNLVCSALHKTHAQGFSLSFSVWC